MTNVGVTAGVFGPGIILILIILKEPDNIIDLVCPRVVEIEMQALGEISLEGGL